VTEQELLDAVIETAHLFGWTVAHFRAAKTEKGWRTPVAADGAGFPDLVLVRERILFVELKSEIGKLSPYQELWRDKLVEADGDWWLWHPSDWKDGTIERILR
jgi:hypothetical protein